MKTSKIIAGISTNLNWITQIYLSNLPHCTGIFISQNAVLTAAHCFNSGKDGISILHNAITGVHIHPNFDKTSLRNDVALVSIAPSAFQRELVQIELTVPAGEALMVSGYGTTSIQTTLTTFVQDINACSDYFSTYKMQIYPQSVYCVNNHLQPGSGTCKGDSGAPVYRVNNSSPIVSGIVSFGIPDCSRGSPTAVASLAPVWPWIRQTLKQLGETEPVVSQKSVVISNAEPSSGSTSIFNKKCWLAIIILLIFDC